MHVSFNCLSTLVWGQTYIGCVLTACLQKHCGQSGTSTVPHPPASSSAQSEQPVRGPLSCSTSNRITQNSLCIPKARLRWECVVSSEACLQGSLIFHLLSLPLPPNPSFSLSLCATSQPAFLQLNLACIPLVYAFVSRCMCLPVACCPFAFPYSTFLLLCLTPQGKVLLGFVRMFCWVIEHLWNKQTHTHPHPPTPIISVS